MTRVEYIRQLEFSLSGKLSPKEISEILRDYSEYFEAGKAEGKTEEEIAVSLGIPSAAAAEILSENDEKTGRTRPAEKPPRDQADKKGDSFFKRLRAWLRRAWERLKGCRLWIFIRDLVTPQSPPEEPPAPAEGVPPLPPGQGAPPEGEEPAARAGRDRVWVRREKRPKPPGERVPAGRWLLGILTTLALIPLIVLLLFWGGMVLFFAAAALVLLAAGLMALAAFCLIGGIAGAMALSLVGALLPESAVLLGAFLLIGCAAAAVLLFCLSLITLRGAARMTRYCLGKARTLYSAHRPAARAGQRETPPREEPEAEQDPAQRDEAEEADENA